MHPEQDLISVGKIIGTHGIKGAVKVISLSDFDKRFTSLDRVFLVPDNDNNENKKFNDFVITANIENSFTHKGKEVVKFQQWDDINYVEGFKNYHIKIPREERPILNKDTYYFDEIIGLTVSTKEGRFLGEVTEIYQTGSNDVYEVTNHDTKQNVLIPALVDVVVEIDLEQGYMIVDPLDGLLDEEED